jgi:tetratricopeptide (TPR) repeat protein
MEQLTLRELEASGLYYFGKDDFPQALLYFKQIASHGAEVSINNFAHLGRVYAKLKLFDEAKEAFEVYVDQVADAYVERFQLGLVLMEMGNQELALGLWQQVLEQQPNFPPALYYKAVVCLSSDDDVSANFLLKQLLETAEEDNLYIGLATELIERNQQLDAIPAASIESETLLDGKVIQEYPYDD